VNKSKICDYFFEILVAKEEKIKKLVKKKKNQR
jgi:hypothetical protein